MTFSLPEVFTLLPGGMLFFFLALWLGAAWRRRRSEDQARRQFICTFCPATIPDTGPSLRLRCPGCGAFLDRSVLVEKITKTSPVE
jgi:hypothetical protein